MEALPIPPRLSVPALNLYFMLLMPGLRAARVRSVLLRLGDSILTRRVPVSRVNTYSVSLASDNRLLMFCQTTPSDSYRFHFVALTSLSDAVGINPV